MSNEAQTYVATLKIGDLTAKYVLSRLADRADERFSCFPSVPLLAAEAEKSERVIQRALAKLREMKLISDKERTRPDNSTTSSRYFLHGPWDDYAQTGVPFATITTPKQKRAEQWQEPPLEGSFRPGTAAAEALSGKPKKKPAAPADEPSDPDPDHGRAAEEDGASRPADAEQPAPPAPAAKKAKKSAAAKKSGKPGVRMTREQAAVVAAVEAAWPAELAALLPKYRPDVIRDAILEAADFARSAEQLVERVQRRWSLHGYADALAPGGKGIGSPVGVAVGLVRPSTDCPDPMCEDGITLHLNDACPKCEQRRIDRKADHRAGRVPDQRKDRGPAPEWWTCEGPDCEKPGKGERPEDGLCLTCREEMLAATERLAAELAADDAERQRRADALAWQMLLEDAYAEHQEREDLAEEARAAAERERQRSADAAESQRIREELLREHPELAQYAQA
ncbi:MAG TPA: helix-turn-helix domain-containing protein [Streptomyces sp.]|uniref:helix-turn-helix domain-containing protein n=1 Tax=Streptomyces sp. TaxID=1931 RepID=UPI002B824DA3|nr:helix-turn-helix domain-containing protein [Streptomyces sp.]HWU08477.1 helix-turn-helix domain-containing protein [Streptomyces sp.]